MSSLLQIPVTDNPRGLESGCWDWSGTHQEKHAAAFFHGTAASQEAQDHDDGPHRDQDIYSNEGVRAIISRSNDLETEENEGVNS